MFFQQEQSLYDYSLSVGRNRNVTATNRLNMRFPSCLQCIIERKIFRRLNATVVSASINNEDRTQSHHREPEHLEGPACQHLKPRPGPNSMPLGLTTNLNMAMTL